MKTTVKRPTYRRYCCMNVFPTSFVFVLLLLVARPAFAQKPAIEPAPTPAPIDSTKQIRSAADTIPQSVIRNGIRVRMPSVTPEDSLVLNKPDTIRVSEKQEREIHKIIPKQATMRSLVLPGLGQAYNRQYYKIPFIYAGFGVMGYLFIKYRKLAKEAETGYDRLLNGDKVFDEQDISLNPNIYPPSLTEPVLVPDQFVKPDYVLISGFQIRTIPTAQNAYNTFRRYRDLNILLSVVLWAVNIVEANVAAHLKTFDLTDDISMEVKPNVIMMPGTGFVPGVRMAFTFK